ncbi:RluA family pseudouridine synthase [Brockia lithotrophica]|uniref:Pseudouridine synthase n=1 Tax=Brockia lithotrophica TaxID=933949 RepID=A0A660KVS2_9BACL|nr:RluA family pseudouridine synthase [Brockia lithotrophica]RKQ84123.1 RluA family pseudouridine synthase [Brockia lithotrophica]
MTEGESRVGGKFTRDERWLVVRIEEEDLREGDRLDEVLRRVLHLSGRQIQRLVQSGGLRRGKARISSALRIRPGEEIAVRLFPFEEYGVDPEDIPLRILYEDDHYLVVDKPPGILVHPIRPGMRGTLAAAVAHHFATIGLRSRVRPVHRLDRDTSGVIVFAKHAWAHARLDALFRASAVRKTYLAVVSGVPDPAEQTIELPLSRRPGRDGKIAVDARGLFARTVVRVREALGERASLVEAVPETGRTHQIRVHLSALGHPIWGDRLYGGPRVGISRQALHAESLEFLHPFTGEPKAFRAPVPEDIRRLTELLRSETM